MQCMTCHSLLCRAGTHLCLESILKQPQCNAKAHDPGGELSSFRVPAKHCPSLLPGRLGFTALGFGLRPCCLCCWAAAAGRAAAAAVAVAGQQAAWTGAPAAAGTADRLQRRWPPRLLRSTVPVVCMHNAATSTRNESRCCCKGWLLLRPRTSSSCGFSHSSL